MENFEDIINEIKQGKRIELSWTYTTIVTILLAIAILIADLFLNYYFKNLGQRAMLILALAVVLNIYVGLQFFFTCEAYLKGKTLSINKIFRKETNIHLDSVLKISSFALKSTKYTIIKYEIEGKFDWALIANSNSIIFGREYSTSEILKVAKNI